MPSTFIGAGSTDLEVRPLRGTMVLMGRSKHKPAVQRYHDRVAGRYDHSYEDYYWQWHDALTWDHLKSFLPADQSHPVLDLGCGTGKWGHKLLKSGYRVTFVDISSAMIEQARRHLEDSPDLVRAEFLQADLCDLSALPEDTFSLAVAFGEPIGCTENPARALKEIRRRLRPGGTLVASFDNRLNAIEFYLETADVDGLEAFLHGGRTHWLTRERSEQFPIFTYSPSQVTKLLTGCGFEMVDMIGKTVLPMRQFREKLADPDQRQRYSRIEKSLCRDLAAMGRCAHLQAVARVAGA